MSYDDAFGEGLAKLLDRVATVKVTQSRRLGQRAFVRAPNGVASAAVALGDGLAQGKRFERRGINHPGQWPGGARRRRSQGDDHGQAPRSGAHRGFPSLFQPSW
jgi:hypothetical protein